MTNLCRARAGDEIVLETGEKMLVRETWNAGGIFQFDVGNDTILSFDISGKSVEGKDSIINLIENETEEDKITYYIPKFDIEFLPVLTVNGEDMIIYQLLDLNNLEIKGDQTLKAQYKYVIVALLQKKLGRDIEVLKTERIICDSKEDCEQRLFQIAGNLKGANIDETETMEEFKKLLTSIKNYAN